MNLLPAYANDDEVAERLAAVQLGEICAVPFCLKAAILLGVPKILVDAGPDQKLTADEIARFIPSPATDGTADATNLDRILRVLASHNLVNEFTSASPENDQVLVRSYSPTLMFKYLVADPNGVSLSPFVRMHLDSVFVSTLQYLHEPVLDRTVEPHVLAHGKKSFEYAATDPSFDKLFNESMSSHTRMYISLLLEQYAGFAGLSTLVDVGGGVGAALTTILAKYPNLKGINFDQPHVVAHAPQVPRLEHVGGDFFESVPSADAVLMKWILHDWSDESCAKILKNIAKALPPHGKIINIDTVLPESSDSSQITRINLCTDVLMMAYNSGGKERTLAQFRKLAAEAGFARMELVATLDNQSILEFYKT